MNKEEDLGIKVGSKEEAEWTQILQREEENLRKNKISQEIGQLLIDLSKKRIVEEKEKFKKED